jgi:hypothetical protein
MTIKQPHEDHTKVARTESKSPSKRLKLAVTAATLEQAVGFDKGTTAVKFVGDHSALNLDLQARETCVLSNTGRGHLTVSSIGVFCVLLSWMICWFYQ